MRVPSSGGVELAVFELGGGGSPLLFSHATGFHGRCYQPMANELTESARCVAFDYRGHGDTPLPVGDIDWQRYGDDATAMATWLAEQAGEPIVAFGHSMGGACLLMAAHRDPSLFRTIVAFEPIVFPRVEYRGNDRCQDCRTPAQRPVPAARRHGPLRPDDASCRVCGNRPRRVVGGNRGESPTVAHAFSTMAVCIRCQPACRPAGSRRLLRARWHFALRASRSCQSHPAHI